MRDENKPAIIFRKRDCSALREVILHANLVNSNVVRAVRRRGNVANGANAGPRNVNANNAPSNANWNYGSGHYSIVQSYPQQSSSQTVRCSSEVPQGIEIPSDWNRLGRTYNSLESTCSPVCRCPGADRRKKA